MALIESLAGKGVSQKDGYVRVADLALYAREVVPQRTGDRQHPILNFEQADNFVLAYYAGGEKEPKELPFGGEPTIESEAGDFSSKANKIADNLTQIAEKIININEVRDVQDFHIGDVIKNR